METQVVDLLGGAQVLGESFQSNLDLVRATREGLPAETAVRLSQLISGFPIDMVAAFAADPTCRLTPEQSDVVVRTATVLARAIDVLGTRRRPSIG